MPTREEIGEEIVLDWYDGPILSIAPVVGGYSDEVISYRMVQVRALGQAFNGDEEIELPDRADVLMRFDREDLVRMLALLDGESVKDTFGKEYKMSAVVQKWKDKL